MTADNQDSIKRNVSALDDTDMSCTKITNADDNILIAQGHAPVLQRTFDLLGSLGLGFR
jgi:choline transport protein